MTRPTNDTALVLATASPGETNAVAAALRYGPTIPQGSAIFVESDVAILHTGVGKTNAALSISRLTSFSRPLAVVNLGIAGTLSPDRVGLCSVVLADPSLFGDEGVQTPNGFVPIGDLGFPAIAEAPGQPDVVSPDPWLAGLIGPLAEHRGPVATVSTCSGVDALASAMAARTGAVAEAMEGAAAGLACRRLGLGFAELRVISNTTGDRPRQRWEIKAAFEMLGRCAAGLVDRFDAASRGR